MKKAMIAVAALAASGTAFAGAHGGGGAKGPNWTFIDAGYLRADSGDEDAEGYLIRGSFEFATKWHVRAEYEDFEEGIVEGDGYAIVLGGHPALTDRTDLVFEVGYSDFELDDNLGDEDGITVSAGLRSMLTDNVDVWGAISSTTGDFDSGSGDSDFTDINLSLGGQYLFTDQVGVGIEYSEGSDKANFFIRAQF